MSNAVRHAEARRVLTRAALLLDEGWQPNPEQVGEVHRDGRQSTTVEALVWLAMCGMRIGQAKAGALNQVPA